MFNSGRSRRHSMALAVCLLAWPYHAALSDGPTPENNETEKDYRRDVVGREARSLKLSLDGDEPEVTLVEEPVLRWRNSIRGGPGGGTYLWTAKGLPVGMCCIWWSGDQTVHLAFHSLTEKPIRAERNGETIWHSANLALNTAMCPTLPPWPGRLRCG